MWQPALGAIFCQQVEDDTGPPPVLGSLNYPRIGTPTRMPDQNGDGITKLADAIRVTDLSSSLDIQGMPVTDTTQVVDALNQSDHFVGTYQGTPVPVTTQVLNGLYVSALTLGVSTDDTTTYPPNYSLITGAAVNPDIPVCTNITPSPPEIWLNYYRSRPTGSSLLASDYGGADFVEQTVSQSEDNPRDAIKESDFSPLDFVTVVVPPTTQTIIDAIRVGSVITTV